MIDPNMAGMSPPQGLSADQSGMPQMAGQPMPPSQAPGQPPMAGPPGQPMPQGQPQQPQQKPPSMIPAPIANDLASALNAAKLAAAQDVATRMGDARGTVNAKTTDVLKVWRKRNPMIDPLYEKIVNHRSDEDILDMMYPMRKALILFGNRTYTEQVKFAERMAKLDADPRYADLSAQIDDEDYEPPEAEYPSQDYEKMQDQQDKEEGIPQQEE